MPFESKESSDSRIFPKEHKRPSSASLSSVDTPVDEHEINRQENIEKLNLLIEVAKSSFEILLSAHIFVVQESKDLDSDLSVAGVKLLLLAINLGLEIKKLMTYKNLLRLIKNARGENDQLLDDILQNFLTRKIHMSRIAIFLTSVMLANDFIRDISMITYIAKGFSGISMELTGVISYGLIWLDALIKLISTHNELRKLRKKLDESQGLNDKGKYYLKKQIYFLEIELKNRTTDLAIKTLIFSMLILSMALSFPPISIPLIIAVSSIIAISKMIYKYNISKTEKREIHIEHKDNKVADVIEYPREGKNVDQVEKDILNDIVRVTDYKKPTLR